MYPEQFKTLLAKLRPVIGEMADAFWLATLLDPSQEKDIQAVAQAMAAELLDESYITKHILLEPPPADKVNGRYRLGTVVYADRPICPFGLREQDLPQHAAILGRSGAGKTNVAYLLVRDLLKAGTAFMVLDWRGTYKHFLNRPEGKNMLSFVLGEDESICFNPLQPPSNLVPNMSEAYLRDIISTICTTYLPGHHLLSTRGVEYFFLRALEFLKMNTDRPPAFNDIRNYMERYKANSREKDWRASALSILFKLTTGPIGRLVNSSGSTTVEKILNKPVILELAGLGSETDRSFFTQTFLLWLYYYRLARGKSRSLKHVLIIEEAHNVFLRRPGFEQTVPDYTLRQFRELGQSLVLLDQNPSLLSIPSLGNTGVTIALNLKHWTDIEAAGKALTLPRENWEHIGRLPVGSAIVKLPDRWQKPFLVRFPEFPEIRQSEPFEMKRNNSRSSSLEQTVQELRSALNEAIRALPEPDRKEKTEDRIGIRERGLLVDIARHPLTVVTERYKRLGWSAHTGTKIKRILLEKELIEQEKVNVPNGGVTLLKLAETGCDLLVPLRIQARRLPKNASLEHEYYKKLVKEQYQKKGYKVKEEVPIGGGKAVDLVATKDGRRVAIEVETGKSDAEANKRKCKEAGFTDIVIVNTTKSKH